MKAVILAAGEGKRMHPLTYTRPKAMVYAAGRPLIWHVLHEAKKAGISEAVVVVKYKKEKILDYFKANDLQMKLEFVEQGDKYGTGAAVLAAKGRVKGDFLVIAGDLVTEAAVIRKALGAHGGGITVAAKKVDDPKRYGVLEVEGGRIASLEEKPEQPKGNLANISIYVMDETVFPKLEAITPSLRGEYEITDVLAGAKCVEVDGFWMDVAYPWNLFDAQDRLLGEMEAGGGAVSGPGRKKPPAAKGAAKPKTAGKVENSTVKGKLIMEEGAEIFDSYVGEGMHYIGAGTKIGPHAYLRGNNSLGRGCEIGESTTIKNSILFDGVKAKHLSYIGDSVIGEGVNFGAGTQIANFRFDESVVNVLTEQGWVSTGRKKFGTVVGDGTKFGVLSCVMPGKTIGSGCWISSGVSVDRNVGIERKIFLRQEKSL